MYTLITMLHNIDSYINRQTVIYIYNITYTYTLLQLCVVCTIRIVYRYVIHYTYTNTTTIPILYIPVCNRRQLVKGQEGRFVI